jgi:YHS domain-containing protein
MTPLRLLIVAALLYVGWRVLRRSFAKKGPEADRSIRSEVMPQERLVEDPVCHVLIPENQALRLRQNGKTYYFCSEQCCDTFAEESKKGEL